MECTQKKTGKKSLKTDAYWTAAAGDFKGKASVKKKKKRNDKNSIVWMMLGSIEGIFFLRRCRQQKRRTLVNRARTLRAIENDE